MKNKLNKLKNKYFNTVLITAFIITLLLLNYTFLLYSTLETKTYIAKNIYNGLENNISEINYNNINKIHVYDNNYIKKFEFYQQKKIISDDNKPNNYLKIIIRNDIELLLPDNIILFSFSNYKIGLEITYILFNSIFLLVSMIMLVVVMRIMFIVAVAKKNTKIANLTVSTQEYVLSKRTTSYLVSIIHHKINTPLKILATKSRILLETILLRKEITKEIKDKSKENYMDIDASLKDIVIVTNKLKIYNELSQNESNIYKLCVLSKETIDILTDDEFIVSIDYRLKLYAIDKEKISSHEVIQIFINQIKFSIHNMADKINFNMFKYSNNTITIFYSDNGNIIDDELTKIIKNDINFQDVLDKEIESDSFDLVLNFSILNTNKNCNITLISSTENGNLFKIKLPVLKEKF